MTQQKPKPTKPVGEMNPDEREVETVRRYKEAIQASKSGVFKKKPTTDAKACPKPDSDETLSDP